MNEVNLRQRFNNKYYAKREHEHNNGYEDSLERINGEATSQYGGLRTSKVFRVVE